MVTGYQHRFMGVIFGLLLVTCNVITVPKFWGYLLIILYLLEKCSCWDSNRVPALS